jgi:hypothetical protein
MKTSKKIFFVLVGTIAGIILAAMIDLRINGRRDSDISSDFKVNRHSLKFFRTLTITNSMNVTLVKNDSSFIEVTSLKDSIAPKVNYSASGDTLRILDFETGKHHNVSIRIHTGDSLHKILLKSTDFIIEHFSAGMLSIDLDQSSVWFNQDEMVKSHINKLNIAAKNHSKVSTNRFNVDSMQIVLQHSEAYLEISAKKLLGTLSDSSRIHARQLQEIWLKKDASSNVSIYDN